jgi:putative tryptophan/tyrosine transport system substrate-binding protein
MRRRGFIALFGGVAVTGPLAARAQTPNGKIPVVGVLWHAGSAEQEDVYFRVMRKAFSDLGYVEGKNIILEHRFPAEQPERFKILARELVDIRPDAIIAVTPLGAIELKKLTSTIPIVFVLVADPVGFGLVESLANPGGNATGLSLMTIDLSGKRLGLLKEVVPQLSRVALLVDRTDPFRERFIKANQAAAEALGMALWSVEVASADDIAPLFAKIAEDGANGAMWGPGGILFVERARLGEIALAHELPTMVSVAEEVSSGLLMSYGQDLPDYFRRAPGYVDKILKGAKPAALPVEQPTTFRFVLNLKTAKLLGLTVPPSVIAIADDVIE